MNILLATSWGRPCCGIQQHSAHLIDAVRQADPTITIIPSELALDPQGGWRPNGVDLLVLNYQRGLHSRWTPTVVKAWKDQYPLPVVIIFHDTFGENRPDRLSTDLCDLADAFIVHEPCLKAARINQSSALEQAIYWRMGVPAYDGGVGDLGWEGRLLQGQRPILGTVGFNFAWKCWPTLAETANAVGWGLLICTPEMSEADEAHLRSKNPWLVVHRGLPHREVIRTLHQCDATAFTNVTNNSGQSAAILDGIAARKPVIALHTCRQYRALFADRGGHVAIRWAETFEDIAQLLVSLPLGRFDTRIVALAEQDSWANLGRQYAALFRKLVGR